MTVRLNRFYAILLAIIISIFAMGVSVLARDAISATDKPLVPNLELNAINGEQWSLHANRGSVIVLNFWATWCQPCRTEMPLLVKVADEYADRGVKVVGVALDEGGIELIRKFVAEYKIDYPILTPPADSPLFGMSSLPTTLLIDAEGRLEEKYTGAVPENVLRADVERIAKPAGTNTGGK
jgi:thiol-disulfide isomerase/thioredoxin